VGLSFSREGSKLRRRRENFLNLTSASCSSDNVAARDLWEEALVSAKAAAQAILNEGEKRTAITKLSSLPSLELPAPLSPKAALVDQEALLSNVVALIESHQSRLKKLASDADEAPARMAALTESLAQARAELDDLKIPVLEAGEIESARFQKAFQMKRLLEAKVGEISAEQDLSRRQADLFSERIRRGRDHLTGLTELQNSLAETIAHLKAKEAEKTRITLEKSAEMFQGVPELKAIIDEVAELNERWVGPEGLQLAMKQADEYAHSIQNTRDRIQEQFEGAKNRISLLEAAKLGVDDETGLLLRQQRARLPSTDELSLELRENLERAAKAQLQVMALSDRINSLTVLTEKRVDSLIEKNPSLDRARIDQLLNKRSEMLRDLSEEYRVLNENLTKGTEASKLTIAETEAYSKYIDQRLLWIKSTQPVSLSEPLHEWGRIVNLFSPQTFSQVWNSIQNTWFAKIVVTILTVLFSLAIFIRRRRLRRALKETSEEAGRRNCTSIMPTFKNMCAAVLLSLWFPLLVWLASELNPTLERKSVAKKGLHSSSLILSGSSQWLFLLFCW